MEIYNENSLTDEISCDFCGKKVILDASDREKGLKEYNNLFTQGWIKSLYKADIDKYTIRHFCCSKCEHSYTEKFKDDLVVSDYKL